MLEDKQARQKAALAEQESSLGNTPKKETVCPVEAGSSDIGRMQRCCLPL